MTPLPHGETSQLDAPDALTRALAHWKTELGTVLIGQAAVIEALLIALLAGGHVVLEGPPGVGKRLVARALALSFGAQFSQIRCGPGLAVASLQAGAGSVGPTNRPGQVLLVSAMEQACAATQAALVEALQAAQEQSVELPPFMLIASRNPLQASGVATLGEALLDRFTLGIAVPFPNQDDETRLVRELSLGVASDMLAIAALEPSFTVADVTALQAKRAAIKVDEQLLSYAVRITRATRFSEQLSQGAGPRAAIALVRCAQARALLQGRAYVEPDDIKRCAPAVLRHRVRLAASQRLEGALLDAVVADVVEHVAAPRP
jgi:MoxR-like ATPase